MPKIPQNAADQALTTQEKIFHVMYPGLVCAVNRKVNTGNYENLDIFVGITVPVMTLPEDEKFTEACAAAAEVGFSIASGETGQRYNLLKNLQKNERQSK